MRWLCCLLVASPPTAGAQSAAAKTLHFDLTAIPATRDSFVFRFQGRERGWAVWQYEIRRRETTQQVVYSASSEFQPVEEERMRVVLDRVTGAPISTFHRLELFSPQSDTVMMEHDLAVAHGAITGRRRTGTKSGDVQIAPVDRSFAPGTVLGDYVLIAGAVTNAEPGDSLAVSAYKEFADSLVTVSVVGERPARIRVPAGWFDVAQLRSGNFRIFATRTPPRRVVKGQTLDGAFSFELVHSGPVIPSEE